LAPCDTVYCDFEAGSLCAWQTSEDQLPPEDPVFVFQHRQRHRRESIKDFEVIK
jgi:hypothetical protein